MSSIRSINRARQDQQRLRVRTSLILMHGRRTNEELAVVSNVVLQRARIDTCYDVELGAIRERRAEIERRLEDIQGVKRCSCGAQYTLLEWITLKLVGHQESPDDGEPAEFVELRNCPKCGTTMALGL